MQILSTKLLFEAAKKTRVFLAVHLVEYMNKGVENTYYMITRGNVIVPHAMKKPDAVVIVATYNDNGVPRLVMAMEFRIPLGIKEIGFPAGLIDKGDYQDENGKELTNRQAAFKAAIREVKEETGLDFTPLDASPANLYSSAGMTNESITYVFGTCTGTPSIHHQETSEEIEPMLLTQEEVSQYLYQDSVEFAHSKTAWPFMWAFSKGFLGSK